MNKVFLLASALTTIPALAAPPLPTSAIRHLIVVVQENHSFDSYFGRYCQAPAGSNPACNKGAACCEAGPEHAPGAAAPARLLDDSANVEYDPNHSQGCELDEIHEGRMDRFVSGAACANPLNFVYATRQTASVYWDLADRYALADRYFQPLAGASSSNDMYFRAPSTCLPTTASNPTPRVRLAAAPRTRIAGFIPSPRWAVSLPSAG